MKKAICYIFLVSNLYAIPPCEFEQQKVCIYLYKGAMSAELNMINMSDRKVIVQAEATLDGYHRKFENWVLHPNQPVTMLKSKYTDHLQKPIIGYNNLDYKFID